MRSPRQRASSAMPPGRGIRLTRPAPVAARVPEDAPPEAQVRQLRQDVDELDSTLTQMVAEVAEEQGTHAEVLAEVVPAMREMSTAGAALTAQVLALAERVAELERQLAALRRPDAVH